MAVTLRQLRYFEALARERHFGRAAEACAISQPALSVQIQELEKTLAARLVERGGREVTITPAGRDLARRAASVLAEVREIEDSARWAGGLSGRLSLGVIPTVAPYLLPAALPLLQARDIQLSLGVREAQTEALLRELREGEIDAAIVALPVDAAGFAATPLFEDRFLLATSAARAADARALRPEDVRPDQLLLLDEGHCLADQALSVCGTSRGATRTDLRATSLSTVARLVASGYGLTLMPEIAAATEAASAPGLALVRFAAPEPFRTIGLVRRAATDGEGWFADLAATLREAAAALS